MVGYHTAFKIFGGLSFMGWYAAAVSSRRWIKKAGFHKKYYPEKYIMPSRRMRKLFKLKKREIPKWLYMELYISFIYIALFVAFSLLYVLFDYEFMIAQVFFWIYVIFMGIDMIRVFIYGILYNI